MQNTQKSKKALIKRKHGFRRFARKLREEVDELFGCCVVGLRTEAQRSKNSCGV